jgi:hypothetical protein
MDSRYNLHFVVTSNSALNLIKQTDAKNILISFYYLKKDKKLQHAILHETDMNILIDSGLFSFFSLLKDTITDEEIHKYCKQYQKYIKETCNLKQFKGYFELDLDLIGKDYETYVKPIQKSLLDITNKIVLIAQKKRTIEDIIEMCEQDVECIAIPFASDVERQYFDYDLITDIAHQHNKRVHLLGCADQRYLNDVEQSDSSTWARASAFGEQNIMVGNELRRFHWRDTDLISKDDANKRSIDCVTEFLKMEKYINDNKTKKNQLRLF